MIATAADMQLGRGEPVEDTAMVLSRMVDAVMIRANRHETLELFAAHAEVPVINGLSDKGHPCQIIADIEAFEEHRATPHFKELVLEQIVPRLEKRTIEMFDAEPADAPGPQEP